MTLRRTVLTYYAYRPTTFPGFLFPVLTLFLRDANFSFAAIAGGGAALAAARLVGEVPSGYLADRLGRRDALVVSAVLFLLGQFGYLLADAVATLLAVSAVLGVAEAFTSGTLDAWLYDVLDDHGATDRYTHVRGRGESVRRWGGAGMMVAAGPLFVVDPAYPFYAMTAVNVLSVALLLTFPRAPERRETETFDPGTAASVVRDHLLVPGLRGFVAYAALGVVVVRGTNTYVQPVAVDVLSVPGVADAATLGVLYAGFTAVGAVASDRTDALDRRLGTERLLVVVPLCMALACVVAGLVPALAIPAFFLIRGAAPVQLTVRVRYLNDRVPSVGRATVLSSASLCYSVVKIPALVAGGLVADAHGPLAAVAGLGACFLVGAGAVFAVEAPFSTPGRAEPAD